MNQRPTRRLGALLAVVAVLATGACSSSSPPDDGRVRVVTSTNVWGDVVTQVGGDLVDVTSLIDNPSADPHSYETNAQAQLALSRAALVVQNGGGYDDFLATMLSALGTPPLVVTAVDQSDAYATAGNEHVWYDLPTVGAVADAVAKELSTLDPTNAARYAANAATFHTGLDGLAGDTAAIAADHTGTPVAVTEPVPHYLLAAAGLDDVTPPAFSAAIENETDVPATVLAQMLDLFAGGRVAALVNNSQTAGPQTDLVVKAAQDAGVPVVGVRETLPAGQDYLTWMGATIAALAAALA